jgi:predicted component of type VI protein secretion system
MSRAALRGRVCAAALLALAGMAQAANTVVEQNPFDPGRKPWKQEKEAAPSLPELTPKDLQIDAIIAFGQFRGIVAQLDGRLKGALPANAAGKVRIQVGQNFGGGYVLAAIEPNHAVVQSGDKRFTVQLLRKINKGGPPAPAVQAQQAQPAPAAPPAAEPAPGAPAPQAAAPAPAPFAAPAAVAADSGAVAAPAAAPVEPAPAQAASPTAQPNSLLDALMKAQEAQKARGTAGATSGGIPFGGKQ